MPKTLANIAQLGSAVASQLNTNASGIDSVDMLLQSAETGKINDFITYFSDKSNYIG